ncbi:nuclear receptor-interacting protein 1 [Polypterus senegalus]|nr:nuclear receptor-interacting protein 1 [Polypterus senegalus]XP_039600480.1 nuclear receptor-interacting protein 1 [Polypterus senegalus]XP_039600481.1 nuclear receptor-interacting protein 1 [Polypterus senegalus]XP_039600482.1 nuclear receptor-interacting protein 1 [Polypterus senegalus]
MTHGEEPGSETHQDSVVLTYLEGLLMHQVGGGSSATATQRSDAGHSNNVQSNKVDGNCHIPSFVPNPEERGMLLSAGTQHLKKARLLQSPEAWKETGRHNVCAANEDLNEKDRDILAGALDSSAKCKQDSTLLASLLQSFSSRLQSVALSRHIMQSLKMQGYPSSDETTHDDEEIPKYYGIASNRLKDILKKNKTQNRISVPYQRRSSQERFSDSPQAPQSNAQAAIEPLSCSARLKAVASLVENRSSPVPSPKPSVACSQLALLLSSEAHLQQYSREQAMKSRLAGRSASERLAAMASQKIQDKRTNPSQSPLSKELLSPVNGQGLSSTKSKDCNRHSPVPVSGENRTSTSLRYHQTLKGKNTQSSLRSSPNCSSLLLHLLNNHNSQKQINGHAVIKENCSRFPSPSPPVPSASEHSDHKNNLTDDSSDAESSHSSCSPIDLSLKAKSKDLRPTGSLEKLTESLISTWKPETAKLKITDEQHMENEAAMKPHQKVTLLQLLLDHKNDENPDQNAQNSDFQSSGNNKIPVGRITPLRRNEECNKINSADIIGFRKRVSPSYSLSPETSGCSSPSEGLLNMSSKGTVNLIPSTLLDLTKPVGVTRPESIRCVSPFTSDTPKGSVSAHTENLLDLRKRKNTGLVKPFSNDKVPESSFSASKLLQNLAQCGLKHTAHLSPSESTGHLSKGQLCDIKAEKTVTLLEKLSAPLPANRSANLEEHNRLTDKPVASSSEIETLLERRTVLQLLLVKASKEKAAHHQKGEHVNGSSPEQQPKKHFNKEGFGELGLEVKIKTEPTEDSCLSEHEVEKNEHCPKERPQRQNNLERFFISTRDLNQDQLPVSPVISKDGLLSQLLKQQPSTYYMSKNNNADIVKEGKEIIPHETILPKKRKLCYSSEDITGSESLKKAIMNSSQAEVSKVIPSLKEPSSWTPEKQHIQSKVNQFEAEAVVQVGCPINDTVCYKDGRGFNVLKQLLLSDNCLKDLSQSRGTVSPSAAQINCRLNGDAYSVLKYPPENSNLQHNRSSPLVTPVDLKVSKSAPARQRPTVPHWQDHLATKDSPQLNLIPVNGETEGPIRWEIKGEEKNESRRASPRLTKSNPILYYMLQKGSTTISNEEKAKKVWTDTKSSSPHRGLQINIKEEPLSDMEDYDQVFHLSRHSQSYTSQTVGHNARLNGILEKVLTVKKEPN